MASMKPDLLSELPVEMFSFSLLNSASTLLAPRLGLLTLARRKALPTPNHVPITSRGALPHVTHDVMRDHLSVGCLYVGLEDCRFSYQL
jgi:queuine tRNA-ribosyltransferase